MLMSVHVLLEVLLNRLPHQLLYGDYDGLSLPLNLHCLICDDNDDDGEEGGGGRGGGDIETRLKLTVDAYTGNFWHSYSSSIISARKGMVSGTANSYSSLEYTITRICNTILTVHFKQSLYL